MDLSAHKTFTDAQALGLEASAVPPQALTTTWLHALPTAAAIVAMDDDEALVVDANVSFKAADIRFDGRGRFDMGELASRIAAMRRDNLLQDQFTWRSGDRVNRRILDVAIAHFSDFSPFGPLYLLLLIDRTAEAESQANQRREMLTDSLTGLSNRTGFEEQIEHRIEYYRGLPAELTKDQRYAVVALDLSRFSRINEGVGTIVGDELILSVATRLVAALRRRDIVARLSGNEFAVFSRLHGALDDLDKLLARIRAVFHEPFILSDLELRVNAAIGLAEGPIDEGEPAITIRRAQIALKRAKTSKKDRIYTPRTEAIARHRFSLETDLRRAIQEEKLKLHFQPLMDLESDVLVGFEALTRWHDPDRGDVCPDEFISIAEDSGLILPLGRWALHEAGRTLADWDSADGAPVPIKLNVNLSAQQFTHDDIASTVKCMLDEHDISGDRLTVELTESAILTDPDSACRAMEALKALDITLALDDFGTGYSNLAHLQRLPIDILKVDKRFVSEMLEDRDKLAIVRAVLSLAGALGISTTAEGIETQALAQTLEAMGCDIGQGYYFGEAMPAADALEFIRGSALPRVRYG